MSGYIEASAPPIREDGLLHTVIQYPDGYWACQMECESCLAAGFYLHGVAGTPDPKGSEQ